jgi:predicted Fe-Mo cluster-binding NifX family protein
MSDSEAFEMLGREIAKQYAEARGETTEQAVESAVEKLTDDDLIAFAVVAMRDGPDGVQTVSQRHIDPMTVAESSHDAETVIESVHGGLVREFDQGVRD